MRGFDLASSSVCLCVPHPHIRTQVEHVLRSSQLEPSLRPGPQRFAGQARTTSAKLRCTAPEASAQISAGAEASRGIPSRKQHSIVAACMARCSRASTPTSPLVIHMAGECRWRRLLKAMVALPAAQAETYQHSCHRLPWLRQLPCPYRLKRGFPVAGPAPLIHGNHHQEFCTV